MYSSKMICAFMHFLFFGISTSKTPWCELCDNPGTHTMCLHPTNKMGGDCSPTHAESPLTANEKKEVLDIHNKYRNGVATGGTKLPKAADMRILAWDDELELVAQRWANQCKFAHDQCRDSERFRVGQNIGIMSATVNPNKPVNYLENSIRAWYDEIEYFDPPDVLLFDGSNSKIGHFTQMVWSSTSLIGCGRVKFTEENNMQGEMTVCNYGQAGNMIGGYIYARGPPCSACPDGSSCCKDYKGLCCQSNNDVSSSQSNNDVSSSRKGLQNKWKNIKDAYRKFCRSNKTKSGQERKPVTKYVFSAQLSFLDKILEIGPTEASPNAEVNSWDGNGQDGSFLAAEEENETDRDVEKRSYTGRSSTPRRRKQRIEEKIEKYIDSFHATKTARLEEESDDMNFFKSLIPMIKPLPLQEKLKFRMDVLKIAIEYSDRMRERAGPLYPRYQPAPSLVEYNSSLQDYQYRSVAPTFQHQSSQSQVHYQVSEKNTFPQLQQQSASDTRYDILQPLQPCAAGFNGEVAGTTSSEMHTVQHVVHNATADTRDANTPGNSSLASDCHSEADEIIFP